MIHLLLAFLISCAVAAEAWPTVREVEASLGAHPGAEFPKMLVTQNGVFHVYYLATAARGNGRYSVEVQLRK